MNWFTFNNGYHGIHHMKPGLHWSLAPEVHAKELAPFNIHVNSIAPGGVMTEMPIKIQGMEKIREKEKKIPLGRWAQPEEISYAVFFLCSPEAAFIPGQVLSPNGGETIVGI